MQTKWFTRVLSVLSLLVMVFGNVQPAGAAGSNPPHNQHGRHRYILVARPSCQRARLRKAWLTMGSGSWYNRSSRRKWDSILRQTGPGSIRVMEETTKRLTLTRHFPWTA